MIPGAVGWIRTKAGLELAIITVAFAGLLVARGSVHKSVFVAGIVGAAVMGLAGKDPSTGGLAALSGATVMELLFPCETSATPRE